MDNKEKYRVFCKTEKNIPIYSKDWWLDALCGEKNWDVVLSEKNNETIASLPFLVTSRKGFKLLGMPGLNQSLGPYIKYPDGQSYDKKLSYEKKVMTELIVKLPKFDIFSQSFHYNVTNWLPFYWKGFSQTTKYTYVIEDLRNTEEVYNRFDRAKKKNIKKASKLVSIKYDLSAEEFYKNHKMTLAKQGQSIEYSFNCFQKLYNACYENNAGKTIYAIDSNNVMHAALFVVWDSESAYDLISTIDPDTRNSGAASLLIYEMIKFTSSFVKKFDFEGSMIESVENSFRQFGAIQKPYFKISRTDSKLIKTGRLLKEIF